MPAESSEEFNKFDKAMDKILSVDKKELDRRIAAEKEARKKSKEGGVPR